jgi:rRNA maturation protein Nop10
MTALPAIASSGSESDIKTAVAAPARWQSKARRRKLRRLEKKGKKVERFSDWENVTWQ